MSRFTAFQYPGEFCLVFVKTGLDKIVARLTNNSLFKKRFFNRPIRFEGSNFDSGEMNGNVIGSVRSKDLTARARGLSPISTTYSNVPCRWRARRPLASRVLNYWQWGFLLHPKFQIRELPLNKPAKANTEVKHPCSHAFFTCITLFKSMCRFED